MTRSVFYFALLFGGLCGCRPGGVSSDNFIRRFGTFVSPDGTKKAEVTRREKSLVDFKVFETGSGKTLASDYVGSDAMRWFLWWETPDRLWGYGSDIGYFNCFEFTASGVKKTSIQSGMEVPQEVWDNLPSTMQRRMKVRLSKK
jgi:hypothetical protein